LESDSIFYTPVLGFFALTGIPTSVSSLSLSFRFYPFDLYQLKKWFFCVQVFLWFKSVEAANKEAQEQDKRDGFL